ncbi:hypothetical protein [Sediminivirga luteola]|uniref:Uncharacterized protein n=1 Tax=Sediminivirga luteola TaxID=1774748 RepID=A0A8J2XKR0_9MICO|nr:hypothetical protein [Sediminivirga luteola]GGA16362.1 hypothetical protein GCM10011333_19330 [Sediminivirga luteola]
MLQRSRDVPLRYGAGIVPAGLEKLYFIGLTAPRGPQIPIYGVQAEVVLRMLALHEAAPSGSAGLAGYLGRLQDADDRIDIVRAVWQEQLADTLRLLDAYSSASSGEGAAAGP